MTSPKAVVDVLIPAYNAERTIEEAIDSIQRQTLRAIRIIVVDDGSCDQTPEMLARLEAADARIEAIRKPNGGIVDALNLGLSKCSAPYIARFDSDDVAYPDRLERQLAYLEGNQDCVAVGGRVDHIGPAGEPLHGYPLPGPPSRADMTRAPAIEPYLIHPFLMVRREAIEAVNGYRYAPNSEDSDIYWRLADRGRLHNLDVSLGKYRMHPDSISSSSIVNSRVMAVSSQLAALSALRRRGGKGDLVFSKEGHQAFKDARTLEGMCAIAAKQLTASEAGHLRIAAAMKLLELAGYRPITPDASDCQFIRSSLAYAGDLTAENKKEINWYLTTTAARLIRRGRVKDAAALMPVARYPAALARAVRSR